MSGKRNADPLDQMLAGAEATNSVMKRAKGASSPLVFSGSSESARARFSGDAQQVQIALGETHPMLGAGEALEVELKLGSMGGESFVSGVQQQQWAKVAEALRHSFTWKESSSHTLDLAYALQSGGGSLRVTYEAEGSFNGCMSKDVQLHRNWQSSREVLSHACRCTRAVERVVEPPGDLDRSGKAPAPGQEPVLQGYTLQSRRVKKRVTFRHASGRVPWQMDLTFIEGEQEFELEAELDPDLLMMDRESRALWLVALISWLSPLLLQGVVDERAFPTWNSLYLGPTETMEQLQWTLRCYFLSCFPMDDRRMSEIRNSRSLADLDRFPFPGTLPRPFRRRNLVDMADQIGGYRVSEKTDGMRYFLLIVNGSDGVRGAWLVNRNLRFHPIAFSSPQNSQLFVSAMAGDRLTLIDGEVITTPTGASFRSPSGPGSPVFIAFDVLCLKGESLSDRPFAEREAALLQRVITPLYGEQLRDAFPIRIIRKRFFSAAEAPVLIAKQIIQRPDEGYFYSDGKQRYHRTDGIVLVPPGAYVPRSGAPYSLKWKFDDLITIDFVLSREERDGVPWYELMCAGSDESLISVVRMERRPPLSNIGQLVLALKADKPKMVAALGDPMLVLEQITVVVEVAFDKEQGLWRFCNLRDKNQPNYLTTVFETMEEIAEKHVSINELAKWLQKNK